MLDIIEVNSDIEEPILRNLLLEYPQLFNEVLKNNKRAEYLVFQALLKNGITDSDTFVKKVDDGLNSIEVATDKNSPEAMKCKIIYLSLRLFNKKMSITPDMGEEFKKLSDKCIEKEEYSKELFNATFVTFYGSDEWNKNKSTYLTGCDGLNLDLQLLTLPDNHMSLIYDIFLKEETEKIARKYFPETYSETGFIASDAIKNALLIVLFRTENFIPKGEKAEVSIFSGASMLSSLDYAIKEKSDRERSIEVKKWFIDYYRSELGKRVAFIKLQVENDIAIAKVQEIIRVIYLPVFESFRYFCRTSPKNNLEQIIKLFRNRDIKNEIKDDILINFVINIQKIVGIKRPPEKEPTKEEMYFKNAFILLIKNIFDNLVKKIIISSKIKSQARKYYERDDLLSDANFAIIELILNFDLSKNDSFIGYIYINLP